MRASSPDRKSLVFQSNKYARLQQN